MFRNFLATAGVTLEATWLEGFSVSGYGTGGTIAPQMLRRLGFHCETVPEQDSEDGWFRRLHDYLMRGVNQFGSEAHS